MKPKTKSLGYLVYVIMSLLMANIENPATWLINIYDIFSERIHNSLLWNCSVKNQQEFIFCT